MLVQVRLGSCVEVESEADKGHNMVATVDELFQDPEVQAHNDSCCQQNNVHLALKPTAYVSHNEVQLLPGERLPSLAGSYQ